MDILNVLQAGCRASDIGVIAPYRHQLKAISSLLQGDSFKSLEVNTVDKYQGRDKSVIIVSFVRSNPEGNVSGLPPEFKQTNYFNIKPINCSLQCRCVWCDGLQYNLWLWLLMKDRYALDHFHYSEMSNHFSAGRVAPRLAQTECGHHQSQTQTPYAGLGPHPSPVRAIRETPPSPSTGRYDILYSCIYY